MTSPSFRGQVFDDTASRSFNEAVLFHYTSVTGALGIIETRSLLCSSLGHVNDFKEITFGFEIAASVAISLTPDFSQEDREEIQGYIHSIDKLFKHSDVFCASFTELEDSLNQWRGYSASGGYCLGFSAEEMAHLAAKQGFQLHKVQYDYIGQAALLRPAMIEFVRVWCQFREQSKDTIERQKALWPATLEIFRLCPVIKNRTFQEEQEWRLIVSHMFDPSIPRIWTIRGGELVPIVCFNLDTGLSNEDGLRDICFRSCTRSPSVTSSAVPDRFMDFIRDQKIVWKRLSGSVVTLR
jgi:Protein of unknown function (DUF2971)